MKTFNLFSDDLFKSSIQYIKYSDQKIKAPINRCFFKFGAADGARTRDPRRDRPVL